MGAKRLSPGPNTRSMLAAQCDITLPHADAVLPRLKRCRALVLHVFHHRVAFVRSSTHSPRKCLPRFFRRLLSQLLFCLSFHRLSAQPVWDFSSVGRNLSFFCRSGSSFP